MDTSALEKRMRAGECFHNLRVLPKAWIIVRLDGHRFSGFTAKYFDKPFDATFHAYMVETARALLERFQGLYAYTESDEISLLFPRAWDLFDRELEKLLSLAAGLASAAFTRACGQLVQFDSRAWVGARDEDVVDYLRWRQNDAARCALNGWCYWTLRKSGRSVADATAVLHKKSQAFKHDLLFEHGINFNELPLWQRRGTGLFWERFAKNGFDPIRNQAVRATRRRIKIDRELPLGDEYDRLIVSLLAAPRAGDQRQSAGA